MRIGINVKNTIRVCQNLNAQGRHEEALELAEQCLIEAGDEADGRWRAFTAIGNISRSYENFPAAIDAHAEALHIADRCEDHAQVAISWNNLGVDFLMASAWDLAIECFSRVTLSPVLVRAWPPYSAHGNLALCHLYLDNIREGVLEIREALRNETPELVEANPHTPVTMRHTFVQLGLLSNRVARTEVERRAWEANVFATARPEPRSEILVGLIEASLEVGFSDRDSGIKKMEALLERARHTPEVRADVLFSLVQAERLAGRPQRALHHLQEWGRHLYPDGPRRAKMLGLTSWMETGATLKEQMAELSCAMRPSLPESIRRLLEAQA